MSNQSTDKATKPQSKLVGVTYMNPFSIFILYDAGVPTSTIPPRTCDLPTAQVLYLGNRSHHMKYESSLYLSSVHTSSSCYDHKLTTITAIRFPAAHG